MCLAVPAKVLAVLDDRYCRVDIGGSQMQVDRSLVDELAVGEIILLHAGFAIEKYDPAVAEEVMDLLLPKEPGR